MFDEEEPKKIKPIDLDDLSVEEIEEMISNHKLEIKNLEILLKKNKQQKKPEKLSFFWKKKRKFYHDLNNNLDTF